MRFGRRRNSDSVPEMVSLEGSLPAYRDSPGPQHPQELPSHQVGYVPYAEGSPATSKSQFLASQRSSTMYNDQHSQRRRRRICGVSPIFVAIGLVAVILIIAGAVVGGVLGTRSTQNKNLASSSTSASQLPAGSATSSTTNAGMTVTTTATATVSVSATSSTSTIRTSSTTGPASIRPTSSARFAGIASANAGTTNVKLFYLDKQKNGIVGYSYRNSSLGWENHGLLTGLTNPPSMSNSIAVAYWVNSNGEGIRLYYVSQTSSLVELVLTCPSQAACVVSGQSILPVTDLGDTSNLSVVQYFDKNRLFRAWVYYINKQGQVARTSYASGWSQSAATIYTTYPGSSIATTMVYVDTLGHKTYYMRSDGTLSSIYEYDDNRTPGEAIVAAASTTSYVDNTANIAACDIPTNNGSYHEGRILRIGINAYPYQEYSLNGGAWTTNSTVGILGKADYGPKDGLSVNSWYDGMEHVRMYYPVGGAVQEYVIENWRDWFRSYTFPNT